MGLVHAGEAAYLRVLIDETLELLHGKCLDDIEDRNAVASMLVSVLTASGLPCEHTNQIQLRAGRSPIWWCAQCGAYRTTERWHVPRNNERVSMAKETDAKEIDKATQFFRLTPSEDWLAIFYCEGCKQHHHMLVIKQRVHYKAFLVEQKGGKNGAPKFSEFGNVKCVAGAPDDKLLDEIEENFGPEEEDEDEDDDV